MARFTPAMKPGECPPFWEMDSEIFQNLCRDLLHEEQSICTSSVYGTRGQAQYGIDIEAYQVNSTRVVVGQCKCCRDFPPAAMRAASDIFFDNKNHWKGKNIQRFILFVASPLETTQSREEIRRQTTRFRDEGIEYEAWSGPDICNKLRAHPGIVSHYFKDAQGWKEIICDLEIKQASGQSTTSHLLKAVDNQLMASSLWLSDEVLKHLDSARYTWREGNKGEAQQWVEKLKSDTVKWRTLSKEAQAQILRFEAGLVLDSGDIERAKTLADEAASTAPNSDERRIRALLARIEHGVEAALELLRSPKDIDTLNLAVSFYLEDGHIEDANRLLFLDCRELKLKPNAETHRLRALMHRMGRKLDSALLEIEIAKELAPRWPSVQFAEGLIRLNLAVVPTAVTTAFMPWPNPVDWSMVLRDDSSAEHLQIASAIFASLLKRVPADVFDYQLVDAWYVATLACSPDRQSEAETYCQEALSKTPQNHMVAAWVIERRYQVDLQPTIKELEHIFDESEAELSQIMTLARCYTHTGCPEKACSLFRDKESLFTERHAYANWASCYAQALVVNSQADEALTFLEALPHDVDTHHAKAFALQARASEPAERRELADYLETSFRATREAHYLFKACSVRAQLDDWEWVVNRSEELLGLLKSSESIRMVAYGLCNADHYAKCLDLLNNNKDCFRQNVLPSDLQRILIRCKNQLHLLPEAISDAERLAVDDPSTPNLLELINCYLATGDIKAAAVSTYKLVGRDDLAPEEALSLCDKVKSQDTELARQLYRRAVRSRVDDELVGTAFGLAHTLGIEEETDVLIHRFAELAAKGKGGIQKFSLQDMKPMIEAHGKQLQICNEGYKKGTMPIHLCTRISGESLAILYHTYRALCEKSRDLRNGSRLLARHGGRRTNLQLLDQSPNCRLNLDITALLLAAHLDILDQVEQAFSPLRIPTQIIEALERMIAAMLPVQPSQLQAMREIYDLEKRGKLSMVKGSLSEDGEHSSIVNELGEARTLLYQEAKESNGYVVDFLPLTPPDLSSQAPDIPKPVHDTFVNVRAVLEALRNGGPLSQTKYEKALKKDAEVSSQDAVPAVPTQGSALYLHANIPRVMTGLGILSLACDHFRVFVEPDEMFTIRQTIECGEPLRGETREWLQALLGRLNSRLRSGIYEFLPTIQVPGGASSGDPVYDSLIALSLLVAQPEDMIWVDDRHINSHGTIGCAPSIDICQVLKGLVGKGALPRAEYYSKMHLLRIANIFFIPIEPQEVIYHLRQSTIKDGRVAETLELEVLRKYVAVVLSSHDILQLPPFQEEFPNKEGEVPFLLSLRESFLTILNDVWKNTELSPDERYAYSEWLLASLYISPLGIRTVMGLANDSSDALYITGVELSALVGVGLELLNKELRATNQCTEYFRWLTERVLHPRFGANEGLQIVVADHVKQFILQVLLDEDDKDVRLISEHFAQRFYSQLPEAIKEALYNDTSFTQSIGFTEVAEIEGLQFLSKDFIGAAIEAVNGREATTCSVSTTEGALFIPVENSPDGVFFYIKKPDSDDMITMNTPSLALLLESPSARERFLRNSRASFDCPDEQYEEQVARIASLGDPQQRLDEFQKWHDNNIDQYYAGLYNHLRARQPFALDMFHLPHPEGLQWRLRLRKDSKATFTEELEHAATELLDARGLAQAIMRLSALPVPLPDVLLAKVGDLPEDEQEQLRDKLLKGAHSPVSRAHLIRVLLTMQQNAPSSSSPITEQVSALVELDQEFNAFMAIATWIDQESIRWDGVAGWSDRDRLALVWAHAHELFRAFMSFGINPGELASYIANRSAPSLCWFFSESVARCDICFPPHVSQQHFVLAALHYATNGQTTEKFGKDVEEKLLRMVQNGDKQGELRPIPILFLDLTLANNALDSFLMIERAVLLRWLTGTEDEKFSAKDAAMRQVVEALERLYTAPEDLNGWYTIYMVLQQFPPREESRQALSDVLKRVNLVEIVRADSQFLIMVLQVLSWQLRHIMMHNVRSHVVEELRSLCRYLNSDESTKSPPKPTTDSENILIRYILEVALAIGVNVIEDQEDTLSFPVVVADLVRLWPRMGQDAKTLVQKLCEDLPVEQARHYWHLNLQLRAM